MPDAPSWLSRGRIPSLAGIRAVAIALVLLQHAGASAGFPNIAWMRWLTELGHLGVEIFFGLSGFLITLLMLREKSQTNRMNMPAFYARRAIRILPAYVIFLLVVALLAGPRNVYSHSGDWLAAVTFTENFSPGPTWNLGHLWTLSIEEQFYLIWPIGFLLSPGRVRWMFPAVAMVGGLACRCVLWTLPAHRAGIHGWTFCQLDAIAAGCLLATLAWEPTTRHLIRHVSRWPIGVLMLTILIASNWLGRRLEVWQLTGALSINAIAIAGLIWWLACSGNLAAGRLFNVRLVAGIGLLSYSLYLWQQIFLVPVGIARPTWHTRFPQNIVLALTAALVSYWAVEMPAMKLKRRFASWGSFTAPAPTCLETADPPRVMAADQDPENPARAAV